MLHIKLKGVELGAPCKHIICTNIHLQPVGGVIKDKKKSECGHDAYQIKGKEV